MRVEILLKYIRKERRDKSRAIIKNDRAIKFAFKLYRKEWERANDISVSAYSTGVKYKSRRFI